MDSKNNKAEIIETSEERVVTKSERVVSLKTKNGHLPSSLYKCMNAVIMALQHDVSSRYDSIQNVEHLYDNDRVYNFKLPLTKFFQYMEWKSTNQKKAKQVISLLEDLRIEWGMSDTFDQNGNIIENNDIGFQQYVSRANISDGMLELRLDPEVRRELLNTSGVKIISLNLKIANGAWSDKYTARLFEFLLLARKDNLKRFSWTLEQFRERMNVNYTIENGKKVWAYPDPKELKRRVINPAVKNINESDFIEFSVSAAYIGRPAREITFLISDKCITQKSEAMDAKVEEDDIRELQEKVTNKLSEYGFMSTARAFYSKKQNNELYFDESLTHFDLQYLLYTIEQFEKSDSKISNPNRYFSTCLHRNEEAFEPKYKLIEKELKEKAKRKATAMRVQQAKINDEKDKLEARIKKEYLLEVFDKFLSTSDDATLKDFETKSRIYHKKLNPSSAFDFLPQTAILHFKANFFSEHYRPDAMNKSELNKRINQALVNWDKDNQ